MMRLAGDGSKEPGCASTDYGNVAVFILKLAASYWLQAASRSGLWLIA